MEAPLVVVASVTVCAEVNVPPAGLKVGVAAFWAGGVVLPPPPLPQPAIQSIAKPTAMIPLRMTQSPVQPQYVFSSSSSAALIRQNYTALEQYSVERKQQDRKPGKALPGCAMRVRQT